MLVEINFSFVQAPGAYTTCLTPCAKNRSYGEWLATTMDFEGDEPSPKRHRAYAHSNAKAPAIFLSESEDNDGSDDGNITGFICNSSYRLCHVCS